jgi:hypothetical protein
VAILAVMSFFGWIAGTMFCTLMSEICVCSGVAMIYFMLFSNRFAAYRSRSVFFGKCFGFVNDSRTAEDARLRTILINECVLRGAESRYGGDTKLEGYLRESRQQLYENVSMKELRAQSTRVVYATPWKLIREAYSTFWERFHRNLDYLASLNGIKARYVSNGEFCGEIFIECMAIPIGLFLSHIMFPLYLLTRFANFSFVWICVLITPWHKIAWLQLALTCLLGSLQLLWLTALVMVTRMHYYTWHIMPGHPQVNIAKCDTHEEAYEKWHYVKQLHDAHIIEPFRKEAVLDKFGPDVGPIVLDYLPTLLTEVDFNEFV